MAAAAVSAQSLAEQRYAEDVALVARALAVQGALGKNVPSGSVTLSLGIAEQAVGADLTTPTSTLLATTPAGIVFQDGSPAASIASVHRSPTARSLDKDLEAVAADPEPRFGSAADMARIGEAVRSEAGASSVGRERGSSLRRDPFRSRSAFSIGGGGFSGGEDDAESDSGLVEQVRLGADSPWSQTTASSRLSSRLALMARPEVDESTARKNFNSLGGLEDAGTDPLVVAMAHSPVAKVSPADLVQLCNYNAEARGLSADEAYGIEARAANGVAAAASSSPALADGDGASVVTVHGDGGGAFLSDLVRCGGVVISGRVVPPALQESSDALLGLLQVGLGLTTEQTDSLLDTGVRCLHQGRENLLTTLFPHVATIMDAGVPGDKTDSRANKSARKRFVSFSRRGDVIEYWVCSWRYGHSPFNPKSGILEPPEDPEAVPFLWPIGISLKLEWNMVTGQVVMSDTGFLGPDRLLLQSYCDMVNKSETPTKDSERFATAIIVGAQARSAGVVARDLDFIRVTAEWRRLADIPGDDASAQRKTVERSIQAIFPGVLSKLEQISLVPALCKDLPPKKILTLFNALNEFHTAKAEDPLFRKETCIASALFAAAGFTEAGLTRVADALLELFGSRAKRFGAVLDNLYSQGSGMGATPFAVKFYNSFPRVQVSGKYLFFGGAMEKPPALAEFLARLSGATGEPSFGPAP